MFFRESFLTRAMCYLPRLFVRRLGLARARLLLSLLVIAEAPLNPRFFTNCNVSIFVRLTTGPGPPSQVASSSA